MHLQTKRSLLLSAQSSVLFGVPIFGVVESLYVFSDLWAYVNEKDYHTGAFSCFRETAVSPSRRLSCSVKAPTSDGFTASRKKLSTTISQSYCTNGHHASRYREIHPSHLGTL